ncbi:MAG: glycosyltransferase [Winogradskyella sp.]|nr:glycosyltransferase [Winogradskyella sp.]NNF86492.1 glycosyltransferase [Winogradskyella sp.]NNK39700.1 glycosyltransferase [Winogradskyella sp.]
MSKKVLIITYYWPPAGGPGVQRWLKFVKYLPHFNVDPIVYCPENANYPIIDPSMINEVPQSVTVLKQPIREPFKLAGKISESSTKQISSGLIPKKEKQGIVDKLLLFARGNFFIPDARKNWIKPSTKFLKQFIDEHKIDTIITTGPPHSLHLIGLQLKQQLQINWIADFRDPWTTIGYHKELKLTKFAKLKHANLERKVLNSADQVVVTTRLTKKEFKSKTNQPVEVITNGYDYQSNFIIPKDTKFTIAHIGSLLTERNPKVLWQVLKDLVDDNTQFAQDLKLKFLGVVSDDVLESINQAGLSDYVDNHGYQHHDKAIKEQLSSQLLLLLEIDSEESKAILPGKMFEYLISGTPIIAIGPKGSDVEVILKQTNTGYYFSHNDREALKNRILDCYKRYQNEELKTHPIGIEAYSRKALTEKLVKLL